jgi:hypothetical protein
VVRFLSICSRSLSSFQRPFSWFQIRKHPVYRSIRDRFHLDDLSALVFFRRAAFLGREISDVPCLNISSLTSGHSMISIGLILSSNGSPHSRSSMASRVLIHCSRYYLFYFPDPLDGYQIDGNSIGFKPSRRNRNSKQAVFRPGKKGDRVEFFLSWLGTRYLFSCLS